MKPDQERTDEALKDQLYDRLASDHPLLLGMLSSLPTTIEYWSRDDRRVWLEMARAILDVVYEDDYQRTAIYDEMERRDQRDAERKRENEELQKAADELRAQKVMVDELDEAVGPRIQLEEEVSDLEARLEKAEARIKELEPFEPGHDATCDVCGEEFTIEQRTVNRRFLCAECRHKAADEAPKPTPLGRHASEKPASPAPTPVADAGGILVPPPTSPPTEPDIGKGGGQTGKKRGAYQRCPNCGQHRASNVHKRQCLNQDTSHRHRWQIRREGSREIGVCSCGETQFQRDLGPEGARARAGPEGDSP